MTTTSERPQRMDALDRREQILACAVRLFEQRPYSQVSTSAIAEEAGVARPLIHHYFGTKRELYLEVVRRMTYLPPLALSGLPLETLEATVAAMIDHWLVVVNKRRRMWLALINIEAHSADSEVQQIIESGNGPTAEQIVDAYGLPITATERAKLLSGMIAYAAFAKELTRQWMIHDRLSEDEVRAIAIESMLALVRSCVASAR